MPSTHKDKYVWLREQRRLACVVHGCWPLSEASLDASNAKLLALGLKKERSQFELETLSPDLEATRRTRDNYVITNAPNVTQASKLH